MKICGRCDHKSDAYWRENNANNQDTVEKCKCDLVSFGKNEFLTKKAKGKKTWLNLIAVLNPTGHGQTPQNNLD